MIHAFLMVMTLLSATFAPGATVPPSMLAHDCGGANKTPELHWSGVPNGTASFALVLHDPDAPSGTFYHWILYDIPGTARSLARGADPSGAQHGTNSTGSADYYGPCPPPGSPHHYVITLYALDVQKIGPSTPPLSATDLQSRIKGHVLGHATLTAIYGR
jgi:Raf kinase inhibitor-like YbhB/YbcL family protein